MPAELTAERAWSQWDAMVSAAYAVLGCREDAADCSTLAVIQVLERKPTDVENVEAYMVTIAKRRALDRLRGQVRERRALSRAGADVCSPDVADDICDRSEAEWVQSYAKDKLDPTVYALLQHIGDGLTIAQAAAATGMSYKAAEGHLTRARRLLREASARAFAVLLGLLAGLRRWSLGPRLSAGVAAAALVTAVLPPTTKLLVSPETRVSPGVEQVRRPATSTPARAPHRPAVIHEASRRPTVGSSQSARSGVHAPLTEVKRAPLTVDTFSRDDGYHPKGPIDRVKHCLETLTLEVHEIGCS